MRGIVASGYADSPVMIRPADYGFAAKIEKPFRLQALQGVVTRLLMDSSLPGPAAIQE